MSGSSVSGSDEIRAVQYLRAAAAILVVFIHTGVYTEQFYWPTPRAFGAAGVDLFFVISGFIMMVVTAQRPTGPRAFLARRLIRVAPLYWLFTLAILAVCLIWPAAMLHNLVTFDHVALSLLFIPHFNPLEDNYTPFFKLGWTLNYEIYFYFVFAALLPLPSIRLRLAILAGLFSLATGFYLVFLPTNPLLHIYCNPIVLEFVIGAAVGYLFTRGTIAKISRPVACALIGGGAFSLVALFDSDDFARVQTAGLASAALMLGLLATEARGALARSPLLMLLGDASYSIYLAHPIVLTLARVGTRALHLPVERPLIGMAAVVTTLALSIAAGVAVHLLVEKPMLALLRRRLLQRAKTAEPAATAAPSLDFIATRLARRAGAAALLICALGVAAIAFAERGLAAEPKRAARLVHEEDFARAGALDQNFWSYEIGFIRNHEAQYYRPENVFVADGALALEGRAEGVLNAQYDGASKDWTRSTLTSDYTSGSIVSRFSMRYGAVEVIARTPKGAGTWPAIWMLGGDDGPPYREIDIVEAVGKHPNIVFTSAHAGPTLDELTNWSAETNVPTLSSQWHVYRLDWSAETIAVSIDGRQVLAVAPRGPDDPLRMPMRIRINLALGGSWGGPIDRNALPARFEIRSIRVYSNEI
ncbi:acyltransferase family protein [Methylosinus sporium]|uniref:acyltransferase family protein n=1 Tax=Methylosinus sporium TaxID=428 RepID=UPI00383BDC3F